MTAAWASKLVTFVRSAPSRQCATLPRVRAVRPQRSTQMWRRHDMSYRLMTVTRRRAARVVASAVGFLALTSSSGLASARAAETQISNSGQIGRLRIDASTGADITRLFGPPDYTTTGNIGQGAPPTPSFRLYGYHCATSLQTSWNRL